MKHLRLVLAIGLWAAAVGSIAGVIGAISRVDRWKEVSKREVGVVAGPVRGGFGGQVSIRF